MEDYIHLNPDSIDKIKRLSTKVLMIGMADGEETMERLCREIESELGSDINWHKIVCRVIEEEYRKLYEGK